MEGVALIPPKPPASSLVLRHTTWLSFFESISSSTLAPWTPAKATESKRREAEQGSGAKCVVIRAGGEGGRNKGEQMEGV